MFQVIDIVVISDIRIYCEGLGQLLSGTRRVNVTCSFDNRDAAMAAISNHPPQVALLDMTMVGSCNLALQISKTRPETKIVALEVTYNESKLIRCAEAGIICYVPREASIEDLVDAIVGATQGDCYCPPKIAACILHKVKDLALSTRDKYLPTSTTEQESQNQYNQLFSRLTPRERQIARLLSEGLSNKKIARELSIEVSTVKNHVHNILVKLEVKNRSHAGFFLLQKLSPLKVHESIDLDPYLEIQP